MSEKKESKRTRNTGSLHLYHVAGSDGCLVPVDSDYPRNAQTRDMERWIADPKSELEDGDYVIVRVVKGVRVGTIRTADFCDVSDMLPGYEKPSSEKAEVSPGPEPDVLIESTPEPEKVEQEQEVEEEKTKETVESKIAGLDLFDETLLPVKPKRKRNRSLSLVEEGDVE